MFSLNKVWQGDRKFRNVLIVVILLVIFLAWQDITGLHMFQLVGSSGGGTGGYSGEVYDKMAPGYMNLFWTFAFMMGFAVAFVYYLIRKDVSEALALFGSFIILVFAGLEDVFYYVFQGKPVDALLPWLDEHIFMGTVANLFGFGKVTNISLFLSVAIGFVLVYFLVKWLKGMKG